MFGSFFTLKRREKQVLKLALRAEILARKLNGISPVSANKHNLVEVLQSTCQLLERVVKHPELFVHEARSQSSTVKLLKTTDTEPKLSVDPLLSTSAKLVSLQEPELSNTMQELIKLRDWVLLAKSGGNAPKPDMLEALYKQLGQVLAKGDVIALEETNVFNYERQQVVSTQVTDSPEKDNWVCGTVRPGYLFHGELVRPQEVIVYTYEEPTSKT
ncbi:nucleotide exchange factor GrpE [Coleofasciculus sp. FACHB-712]|nr:nucleotide exchange factor GrpE [Coleofasciculus sp. FACHB-712]